jgi:hypothetical protein
MLSQQRWIRSGLSGFTNRNVNVARSLSVPCANALARFLNCCKYKGTVGSFENPLWYPKARYTVAMSPDALKTAYESSPDNLEWVDIVSLVCRLETS